MVYSTAFANKKNKNKSGWEPETEIGAWSVMLWTIKACRKHLLPQRQQGEQTKIHVKKEKLLPESLLDNSVKRKRVTH